MAIEKDWISPNDEIEHAPGFYPENEVKGASGTEDGLSFGGVIWSSDGIEKSQLKGKSVGLPAKETGGTSGTTPESMSFGGVPLSGEEIDELWQRIKSGYYDQFKNP